MPSIRIALAFAALLTGCQNWQSKGDGLQRTWEKGCFRVDGALMPPDDPDQSMQNPEAADPATLFVKIALSPSGNCPELHGGSADVVTGFGTTKDDVDAKIARFDHGLRSQFWIPMRDERRHPAAYLLERTYGMADSRTFVLSFPVDKELRSHLERDSKVEIDFEIPIPGARLATLTWPAAAVRRALSKNP